MNTFAVVCLYMIMRGTNIKELCSPYNITTLLPFNEHSWFGDSNALELKKLIKIGAIKNIVELGSWMGGSTRFMAKLLPVNGKIYAVDFWGSDVADPQSQEALEKTYDLTKIYDQFLSNVIHANLTDKIVPIRMSTMSAAKKIAELGVEIDLVYVDASHDEISVYQDISTYWPFVSEKGIMCGDDYEFPDVKKAVTKFATEHNLKISVNGTFWKYNKIK